MYLEVVQMPDLLEEHEHSPSASEEVLVLLTGETMFGIFHPPFPMLAHNHNHVGMF